MTSPAPLTKDEAISLLRETVAVLADSSVAQWSQSTRSQIADTALARTETLAEEKDAALLAENERLRELLRGVEWVHDSGFRNRYCPICSNSYDLGHAASCGLRAALKGKP